MTGQNNPIILPMMNLRCREENAKELLTTTIDLENPINTFLNKFSLHKTLRVRSLVNRSEADVERAKLVVH